MASKYPKPFDLKSLRVYPLASRQSMSQVEEILVEPSNEPPPISDGLQKSIRACAAQIKSAIQGGSGVMLIYGAHLIKNGGQLLLNHILDHVHTVATGRQLRPPIELQSPRRSAPGIGHGGCGR